MKIAESKAEIYLMALESLSRAEKKAVITHLLEDETLRENILDIALIQKRKGEPSRPFREYLGERNNLSRSLRDHSARSGKRNNPGKLAPLSAPLDSQSSWE